MGFSFFMGLSVPQYFNEYTSVAGYGPVHTSSRWVCETNTAALCSLSHLIVTCTICYHCIFQQFNDMINVPFSSKPFVAALVAFFLDNTIHRRDGVVRRDRGYHWWDKFRSFKTDSRSEEFYSLPFNLNKFFPSV
jgi:hypothetical protein